MYPMSILRRMNLISYLNPEQDGSMYTIRTLSNKNLCILLEPGAGWIYVFSQKPEQDGSMYPIRTYLNPEQDESKYPI